MDCAGLTPGDPNLQNIERLLPEALKLYKASVAKVASAADWTSS
jgi:hypothetical protein